MKQVSLEFNLSLKKNSKLEFLKWIDKVIPWQALIQPYYPESKRGAPFSLVTMPRTHFLQQCFTLPEPGMEDVIIDIPFERVEKAKVDHSFWLIKCLFGYVKTRYRELKKNSAQLVMLFALSKI